MTTPLVGIIMGSDSDLPTMQAAIAICEDFAISHEVAIVSAHRLIQRFGVLTMIQAGAALTLGCMAVNLAGTSFWHFAIALLLLGLGWNFMYVGSTTLLTQTHTPTEKGKVQAAHDFLVFSFVAFATLLSGRVFYRFDWAWLNQLSWPLVLLTLFAVIWLQQTQRRQPQQVR